MKKLIAMLNAEIDQSISEPVPLPIDPVRSEELHPSSYPFCGLKHAYERMIHGGHKPKSMDFYGEYYTKLGTMKHELLQEWIGKKGGSILGNWKCSNKECGHVVTMSQYVRCPKCKSDTHYQEVQVRFGKYTVGHIDGIWKPFRNKEIYIPIDYKTSSEKKMYLHKVKKLPIYPHGYNKAQIKSYCVYLQKQYKLPIAGWLLIYLTRDSSLRSRCIVGERISREEKAQLYRMLKIYDYTFGIAKSATTPDEFEELVKYKPCATKKQYKDEMHKYDMCPLADGNKCFKEDRLWRAIGEACAHYENVNKKKSITRGQNASTVRGGRLRSR